MKCTYIDVHSRSLAAGSARPGPSGADLAGLWKREARRGETDGGGSTNGVVHKATRTDPAHAEHTTRDAHFLALRQFSLKTGLHSLLTPSMKPPQGKPMGHEGDCMRPKAWLCHRQYCLVSVDGAVPEEGGPEGVATIMIKLRDRRRCIRRIAG
jgi:hypothetical protein